MNNVKRISVYFNLDVPSDKKLYDYLISKNDGKRISQELKRAALDSVSTVSHETKEEVKTVAQVDKPKEKKKKLNLSDDDMSNLEGMFKF